ncbi:hypothetical protein [Tardiphaga sp. 839_C3_N1_4]|uniref:hypothetical protein n=1 Tax=Tardiphaga sp. 839_C3_N1_4 TaxID=3240761 RepID=UPI003F1EDC5A
MNSIATHPLRAIVARPTYLTEELACGHVINRPLSCGELAMEPSKAQRRRCYHCQPEIKQKPAPAKRKSPARTYSTFVAAEDDFRVKHGNKIVARFKTDAEAVAYILAAWASPSAIME